MGYYIDKTLYQKDNNDAITKAGRMILGGEEIRRGQNRPI